MDPAPLLQQFERTLAAARGQISAETVHQLRVAIRRLQSALRLMRLRDERRAFRPLLRLAGEVRNRDIALGLAGDRSVQTEIQRQREEHSAALAEAVAAFQIPAIAARPVRPPRRLLKDFFRAGRRATRRPSAERLHALRLAGKRLRYALEFLAPLLDPHETPQRLKELKRLQDHLGEANDCATSRTLAHDAEFHAFLEQEEAGHQQRSVETWRGSFGVLGAWESWCHFLAPLYNQACSLSCSSLPSTATATRRGQKRSNSANAASATKPRSSRPARGSSS